MISICCIAVVHKNSIINMSAVICPGQPLTNTNGHFLTPEIEEEFVRFCKDYIDNYEANISLMHLQNYINDGYMENSDSTTSVSIWFPKVM